MDTQRGAWKHNEDSIVIKWQEDEKYRSSEKANGWTEEYCRYLDHLPTIDISHTAPWHQKYWYESTTALMMIVKLDGCEHEKIANPPRKFP